MPAASLRGVDPAAIRRRYCALEWSFSGRLARAIAWEECARGLCGAALDASPSEPLCMHFWAPWHVRGAAFGWRAFYVSDQEPKPGACWDEEHWMSEAAAPLLCAEEGERSLALGGWLAQEWIDAAASPGMRRLFRDSGIALAPQGAQTLTQIAEAGGGIQARAGRAAALFESARQEEESLVGLWSAPPLTDEERFAAQKRRQAIWDVL